MGSPVPLATPGFQNLFAIYRRVEASVAPVTIVNVGGLATLGRIIIAGEEEHTATTACALKTIGVSSLRRWNAQTRSIQRMGAIHHIPMKREIWIKQLTEMHEPHLKINVYPALRYNNHKRNSIEYGLLRCTRFYELYACD